MSHKQQRGFNDDELMMIVTTHLSLRVTQSVAVVSAASAAAAQIRTLHHDHLCPAMKRRHNGCLMTTEAKAALMTPTLNAGCTVL
jgi:hypothetical protein